MQCNLSQFEGYTTRINTIVILCFAKVLKACDLICLNAVLG